MNPVAVPVILSGGIGSRLWPLSRESHPKQFIELLNERTLFQTTALRLASIERLAAPVVVCNEAHRFVVSEQLRAVDVTPASILLEPTVRNTAPAIAAAALEVLAQGGGEESILLVLPVDHFIGESSRFASAVCEGLTEAAAGNLVTFGVVPSCPETGYGYIRAGRLTRHGGKARAVDLFVEKPDAGTAAAYVEDRRYFWNSGIFAFGAKRFLEELRVHAPDIMGSVAAAHGRAVEDLGFLRLDMGSFAESPAISVDHAVLERTSGAVMVPLEAGWRDIGSWAALSAFDQCDANGNAAQGDAVFVNARNTSVRGDERLIVAVGVSDLIIADTVDAVLVADKQAAQDIGSVVAVLKSAGREEYRSHRRVHRPWGLYEVLHKGDGFKLKRIVVAPGGLLSLQSHRHRAEHWIVVRGVAQVTRAEETFEIMSNQSICIPPAVRHRLENPGTIPLELIEVQTGGYLGEDDIVRYEDAYGRAVSGRRQGKD